jgi:hypothetical protein
VSNRPPVPAAPPDPPPQLDDVLAEVPAAIARLTHLLRTRTLRAHPDLRERVYPGWRGLGFHHPSTGYLAALFPQADDVLVGFNRGGDLPDPHGRLLGTRRRVRYLRFHPDPATGGLADAEGDLLEDYLDLAVDHAVDLRAARDS